MKSCMYTEVCKVYSNVQATLVCGINHLNINGRSLLEFLSVTLMFEGINFMFMATCYEPEVSYLIIKNNI